MNKTSLHNILALSEDFTRQFKADVKNADSLASEMATFVNTSGMDLSGRADPIRDLLSMESTA